jgi:hypothetical protein
MRGRYPKFAYVSVLFVALLCGNLQNANASAISTTADPFPGNTVLTTGTQTWQSADFQILDGVMGSLNVQSDVFSDGDETLTLSTIFTGQLVYVGTPGATAFSLPGTFDVTITGRSSSGTAGSWAATLQNLAVAGSVGGIPVAVTTVVSAVSVSSVSAGTVAITAVGPSTFNIDDSFTLFAQISRGGASPEPFDPLLLTNTDIPEPATLSLLALPLAGAFWARRRRARG